MISKSKSKKNTLRLGVIENSYKAKACHIGSALSSLEILEEIFKKKKKDDLFIFAKASGAVAYYLMLAQEGIIPHKKVAYYLKRYPLPSKEVPGVIWSGGSLGHGLPVACGLALGNRKRDVYVLMSDGEIQEGTTWESILFARQHKLKNLKIYIDKNGLQACGRTKDIMDIDEALEYLNKLFPLHIRKTIKGKSVGFMENKVEWHYFNLTKELHERAISEINNGSRRKR